MKLKSFGCSFIYGTDLPDCGPLSCPSGHTWPALISKRLGLEYRCIAEGGCGNLSIMDRVLEHANLCMDVIFVIQWTYIDRFDYSHPFGRHYANGKGDWHTLRPNDDNEISKFYYQRLHSEFRDRLTSLIYIHGTIQKLKAHGIPFVMTCLDDLLLDTTWHDTPTILDLQSSVRPHIQSFENQNFLSWSHRHGFPNGPTGHPLEPAHQAAAAIMAPFIDAILHKA